MTTYYVFFEHCHGGDAKLPQSDRGFFDGWFAEVNAADQGAAAKAGMEKMYAFAAAEHPEWVLAAIDDLAPRVCVDKAGTPAAVAE